MPPPSYRLVSLAPLPTVNHATTIQVLARLVPPVSPTMLILRNANLQPLLIV